MRFRPARLVVAVAIAGLGAACVDSPQPAGPSEQIQASAARQEQAARWFAQASPAVLALAGTVFADHDEATGRLVFGIEHAGAAAGVRTALARLGIPADAYDIQVTEPIRFAATLRDRWRPTIGGIQIHFGQYVCTMGFNADEGTDRSFITNSHCTNTQGGVEGTEYFQPTSTVDPTVIAVEVEDPNYFKGGACPRGRRCRYSDASRALYSAGVASTRGSIAQTTGPNNGSLTVAGSFTITAQDNNTT
ncbi:MAG TPA: hypothetical protein VNL98_07650, partial [Gemmatimonadales bacterium]|nr:hypothetical protein [Gemmatimonadales bacterium]